MLTDYGMLIIILSWLLFAMCERHLSPPLFWADATPLRADDGSRLSGESHFKPRGEFL